MGRCWTWCFIGVVIPLIVAFCVSFLRFGNSSDRKVFVGVEKSKLFEGSGGQSAFDKDLEIFRAGLRIQTYAHQDDEGFAKITELIQLSYPLVHEKLIQTKYQQGIMYKWVGKIDDSNPIVLLNHLDTVPVVHPQMWSSPPLQAELVDNFIYARGALDDKIGVFAILSAVEHHLREGLVPNRTIFLCFGFDEEISGGLGALEMSKYFEEMGISPIFILDEGGVVYRKGFVDIGIEEDIALIGMNEKGEVGVKLHLDCDGGHFSVPPIDGSCASQMSEAIARINNFEFPAYIRNPMLGGMVESVFSKSSVLFKAIFSIARHFPWVLEMLLSTDPAMQAVLRTQVSVFGLQSGDVDGYATILPRKAEAALIISLHPFDSVESVLVTLKRVIDDENIQIELDPIYREVNGLACVQCAQFEAIEKSIRSVFDSDVIVSPFLYVGGSDLYFYRNLTTSTYNFLPIILDMTTNDLSRLHGVDERISISNYKKAIQFYFELITNLNQDL